MPEFGQKQTVKNIKQLKLTVYISDHSGIQIEINTKHLQKIQIFQTKEHISK